MEEDDENRRDKRYSLLLRLTIPMLSFYRYGFRWPALLALVPVSIAVIVTLDIVKRRRRLAKDVARINRRREKKHRKQRDDDAPIEPYEPLLPAH